MVAPYIRRQFSDTVSYTDQLSGGINNSVTSFTLKSGTTFPDGSVGPFICTLDPGIFGLEEKVLVTARTGAVCSGVTRGWGGTTAQTHSANASVLHTLDKVDLDEANQAVVATLGTITTTGDTLYANSSSTLARLGIGAANQVLTSSGSAPQWTTLSSALNTSGFTTGLTTPSSQLASTDGTSNFAARADHFHSDNKRVVVVTQSATPAINTNTTDVASITGLAQAITSMTTNLTGTPADGNTLIIRITDNGTARAITWGASFEASTVALPTTTVASAMLVTGFIWNTVTSAWRCVGVA